MSILSRTKVSGFSGNVIKLVTGNVLSQGIAILIAPVVTRLFAPEAFGIVAMFTSITGMASIVACFRYDLAIPLPKTDGKAVGILGLSIGFILLFTAMGGLTVCLAGDWIALLLNAPELGRYLWLAPFMTLFQGTFSAFSYWVGRRKQFEWITESVVLQALVTQSTKLAFGFAGYLSGGILIATTMMGNFVSTGFLGFRIFLKDRKLLRANLSLGQMMEGLRKYKRFPLIDMWSTILNTVSWQIPVLLLGSFFSPSVAGYYALGFNLVNLPMGMVGSAIGQVFFQRAAEAHVHGGLADLVTSVFRRLVSFGLFPLLMLTVIGKEIFSVVFGSGWSEAGVFVQIISPWLFFVLMSSPLSNLPLVLEKQPTKLMFNIVIFGTRVAALLVGGYLGNARMALFLFSSSGIIVYGLFSYYLLYLSKASLRECSFFFFEYALVGIIGLSIILFAKSAIRNPLALVAVSCLLVALYESWVICRDPQIRYQIVKLLSSSNANIPA